MIEQEISLNVEELTVLNRLFNILGEENLRANFFTRADIDNTYSVLEKVREALFDVTCKIEDRVEVAP